MQLQQLDTLNISFNGAGASLLNIFLAIIMYGVALGINPRFFKGIFEKPNSLLIGLLCQWILLPLSTYLLVVAGKNIIPPMMAMGLILVASCPGGTVSNFMTSYAKGNSELSILMTSITTMAAPIFTPINFAVWGGLYVKYLNKHAEGVLQTLQIPLTQIFITIFLIIGLPLILGVLTVKYTPSLAKILKPLMSYFSVALFIAIVAVIYYNNSELFARYIKYVFVIVLFHNFLALVIGYIAGTVSNMSIKDRRSVTIEVGIQNSGLGLLLLLNTNIFPNDLANGGMVFVTAWWGVWHIISGLGVATIFRLSNFDTIGLPRHRTF
ncbi:MAG TPA: bile acid:sodium symporter family protein [Bacteroidaceae bacterium]|nr:bile acid:sodium symporter family protein [Bacteroidaceae bacterium]